MRAEHATGPRSATDCRRSQRPATAGVQERGSVERCLLRCRPRAWQRASRSLCPLPRWSPFSWRSGAPLRPSRAHAASIQLGAEMARHASVRRDLKIRVQGVSTSTSAATTTVAAPPGPPAPTPSEVSSAPAVLERRVTGCIARRVLRVAGPRVIPTRRAETAQRAYAMRATEEQARRASTSTSARAAPPAKTVWDVHSRV